jgi:hypothetical protein
MHTLVKECTMALCFGLAGRGVLVFQSQSAGKVASVIPIEFEKSCPLEREVHGASPTQWSPTNRSRGQCADETSIFDLFLGLVLSRTLFLLLLPQFYLRRV